MKNNRFVRIDCDTKTYSAYVDGKMINSVQSDEFLDRGFIERFRAHTDDVMRMVDETEEEREARLLNKVLERADKLDW